MGQEDTIKEAPGEQESVHLQVCLLIELKLIAHFPAEVDGDVWKSEDGPVDVHQAVHQVSAFLMCERVKVIGQHSV